MIDLPEMLNAKETGRNRWLARCPAHEDKSPSLSITQTDDGTWLYKCWAGCDQISVVHALGIEFSDLFPNRRIRRVDHSEAPRLSARDALLLIDHEVSTAWVIASDFQSERDIDEQTWERLTTAASRIGEARSACGIGAGR